MSTATALSDAARCRDTLIAMGATAESLPFITIPSPSTVSHHNYKVAYFDDCSILIWARGHGFELFDEERTYYRDTLEHLARCLAIPQADRAEMIRARLHPGNEDLDEVTIDGVRWSRDGSFVRI